MHDGSYSNLAAWQKRVALKWNTTHDRARSSERKQAALRQRTQSKEHAEAQGSAPHAHSKHTQ